MRKYILSPSLLAADFNNLEKDIRSIEKAGVTYLHLDIMDGMFVPSYSFGFPVLNSIRQITDCFFDVHLMIENPDRYLKDFVELGADSITVHAEACKHLDRTVQSIRELGAKVGVALNPATPLSALDWVLDKIDMVLIMTVNPGFGGQKFIPSMLDKISELKSIIDEKGYDVDIQVDGGISSQNVEVVMNAGANVFVAGSAIFGENTEEKAREFMDKIK
ncbi:MAG: ribulose-phosphate 3-epimerase [Tyzzerella sp.]|uniref:Ribulose-phosphate 3-epimerase n=1 Tax=Candidatus Fimicola merdigallinarum TaxID=2840819 RepID=A0A9D9DW95_9FIRM|nr:ribulose-phosphate 3-epimerase [Candidatus Fimicola merdigallinarum]